MEEKYVNNRDVIEHRRNRIIGIAIGFTAFIIPAFAWLAETNIGATLNGLQDWKHISYFQVWGPLLGIGIAAGCIALGIYLNGRRWIFLSIFIYCAILSVIAIWYFVLYPSSEWRW